MAEPYRDEKTSAPQNPPNSVLNPRVRRAAFWTYVGTLAAFFLAIGVVLFYVATRPPDRETKEENAWDVTGTTGETSPGGHSPDLVPASPEKEIEERGVIRDLSDTPVPGVRPEAMLTKLGAIVDAKPDQIVGHRVELQDVSVVDVESSTSFSVQDGRAKVAVVAPEGSPALHNEQRVNLAGTVERNATGGVRIRASRVETRY